MKNNFFFLVILFLGFSVNAQKTLDQTLKKYNKNNVPYISATELRMLQAQENVIIIDSREQKEFNVSHISSAIFVGYDHFSLEEFSETIPEKDTPIVVYCTLGIRSEITADKLVKTGYTNVRNLYGGICEWKNKDFKVMDSTNTETQNVHTFNKQWSKWLQNGKQVY